MTRSVSVLASPAPALAPPASVARAVAGRLPAAVRYLGIVRPSAAATVSRCFAVPSLSVRGTLYIVTVHRRTVRRWQYVATSCTCPAGAHARPCKHVAAVLVRYPRLAVQSLAARHGGVRPQEG